MTKSELINQLAKEGKLNRKESEVIVNTIFNSIIKALANGDKVELRGFGSFTRRERKAKQGRNPKSGQSVNVAAKRVPFFKAGQEMKILR